jgi:hypothetical protein
VGFTRAKFALIEAQVENWSLRLLESDLEAIANAVSDNPIVKLLPAFDSYMLGYSNRDYLVSPNHQKKVYHGGQIVPVVLVNGCAAGVWRYKRQGKYPNINVQAFDSFDKNIRSIISEEAEDLGHFFGTSVLLNII